MLTNIGFYITWLIATIIPLLLTIFSDYEKKTKIIACLLVLIIGFGLTALRYPNTKNENARWNNGICCECGGTYEFSSTSQTIYYKFFYYTCNKCGHTEEFKSLRK